MEALRYSDGDMPTEKLLPIKEFLDQRKSYDRVYIPDSDLDKLVNLFAKITNIYIDMSWRNPMSVMESLTVALSLVTPKQSDTAYVLGSSKNTVKTYQSRAKAKFNTESKVTLIRKIIELGVIKIG